MSRSKTLVARKNDVLSPRFMNPAKADSNWRHSMKISRKKEMDQIEREERKNKVKYVINLVWDCLCPSARKNLVIPNEENMNLMKEFRYFEFLSLDNKVEFFGYNWEKGYQEFIENFWPLNDSDPKQPSLKTSGSSLPEA